MSPYFEKSSCRSCWLRGREPDFRSSPDDPMASPSRPIPVSFSDDAPGPVGDVPHEQGHPLPAPLPVAALIPLVPVPVAHRGALTRSRAGQRRPCFVPGRVLGRPSQTLVELGRTARGRDEVCLCGVGARAWRLKSPRRVCIDLTGRRDASPGGAWAETRLPGPAGGQNLDAFRMHVPGQSLPAVENHGNHLSFHVVLPDTPCPPFPRAPRGVTPTPVFVLPSQHVSHQRPARRGPQQPGTVHGPVEIRRSVRMPPGPAGR